MGRREIEVCQTKRRAGFSRAAACFSKAILFRALIIHARINPTCWAVSGLGGGPRGRNRGWNCPGPFVPCGPPPPGGGPPGPSGGGPPGPCSPSPPMGGGGPPASGPPAIGPPSWGGIAGALVPIGRGPRGPRGLGGIAVSGSSCETALTSRLLALSPTVSTGPCLAPFKTPSRESRRNMARGRSPPWQRTQEALKIGAISLSNVTPVSVAAGGSLLQSTGAAESCTTAKPAAAKISAVFMLNWFG